MAQPPAASPDAPRVGDSLLELERVLKAFGRRAALRDVSLAFPRGSLTAVLGPNGAGKTTLLRIAAGLARPTRGRLIFEGSPRDAAARIRPRVGYVAHQTLLYDALTPRQNLHFFTRLYGIPAGPALVAERLARFGLEAHADRPVATLSRGLQQRLALARALLHDPDLLLLDEPATGLDPDGVRLLVRLLEELRGARATIVMATHAFDGSLEMADGVAILDAGQVRHAAPRGSLSAPEISRLYVHAVGGAPPSPPSPSGAA